MAPRIITAGTMQRFLLARSLNLIFIRKISFAFSQHALTDVKVIII
jgi:hypothetical protein